MLKSITANLMVESVEKTLSFYKETLGFSEVASVPNDSGKLQFAIVAKDGCQLMFQERVNLCAEYPTLTAEITKPSITLFIMVDDFDACYASIKAKRKLLAEEHATFYGTKEFAVADNNGYVLTFAEQH